MGTGSRTTRWGRAALLLAFVAVVGSATWWQYDTQRVRADRTAEVTRANADVLAAVVGTENAARDYIVTRDTSLVGAYNSGRLQLAQAVRAAGIAVHDDAELRTRLAEERALIEGWETAVAADVAATGPEATANAAARAAARDATLDRIRATDDELARALDRQNREDSDHDEVRGIALLVGVCAAFAVLHWVVFVRTERRDAEARDRQIAFAERLQDARTQDEARAILTGHLEELVPGATVVVTGEDDRSPAARPIVARGERIGSVAFRANRELRGSTERWVHDSILRAAPVLATLQTLADAQARAATDPLTGLGNRRLVEDALSRAAAQAQRTGDGFAVAMIDVDRFKRVNDTFGHEAGDALLKAIADALSGATREYDVVGRHGGDEFIVLLPGLDIPQATVAMERCRARVAALAIGTPPVSATASFGVAASPPGGPYDPTALVRAADEAVYAAKARGGDTVVGRTLANV
ncbi:MAG TPA: diguanylate cyclase [Acidimicrobiia bacterium]|nr:diguanylate cyclase [Acidimicrobiia bacterium]